MKEILETSAEATAFLFIYIKEAAKGAFLAVHQCHCMQFIIYIHEHHIQTYACMDKIIKQELTPGGEVTLYKLSSGLLLLQTWHDNKW